MEEEIQNEGLNERAQKAHKIIKNSPTALSTAIQCVNANYQSGVDGLDFEVAAFGDCFGTQDFKEGTQAFLNKRKAEFLGE
mgnify:CR=1 FL=1